MHVAWTGHVTGTIAAHIRGTIVPHELLPNNAPRVWYKGRRHHDDGLASQSASWLFLHSSSPHPRPRVVVSFNSGPTFATPSTGVVRSSHCARRACQQGIASRQFGSPPVGHATCRQRGTRSVRRSCLQATIVCGGRPHQDPSHQSWPRVHRLATRGGCIPILNGEWWDTVLSSWCGE